MGTAHCSLLSMPITSGEPYTGASWSSEAQDRVEYFAKILFLDYKFQMCLYSILFKEFFKKRLKLKSSHFLV